MRELILWKRMIHKGENYRINPIIHSLYKDFFNMIVLNLLYKNRFDHSNFYKYIVKDAQKYCTILILDLFNTDYT